MISRWEILALPLKKESLLLKSRAVLSVKKKKSLNCYPPIKVSLATRS